MTQINDWSVLILEAGGEPSLSSEVPAFYHTVQNSMESWQHVCAKQDNACLGTVKKSCVISQGKVLGGTTSVNNLHYTRGNNRDFFNWSHITSDEWNLEDIFAHYKRIEDFQRDEDDEYPIDYGRGGEIKLSRFNQEHFVKEMITDAAYDLKYGPIVSQRYLGYIETLGTLINGKRLNMAKAFLSPIKNRTNLYVARNALVTKILFSQDKKAIGVKALIKSKEIQVRAKKEVIVTGDPINTAKLLMISGIGKRNDLQKYGIPVISEVPTGKHFKAQIALPVFVAINHDFDIPDKKLQTARDMYEFMLHNRGTFTSININDLLGYISAKNQTFNYPDIQMYHSYFRPNSSSLQDELALQNYDFDIIKSVYRYNKHRGILLFKPTLLHPESNGEILVTSYCHENPPMINGNFLTDKLNIDIDTLVTAFRFVESMSLTKAFQRYNASILYIDVPNCRNLNFYTDAYIKCYIKNLAYPRNIIGSARMSYCKFDGVVDKNLLVYDTRGLRVAGASAMPTFSSGNLAGTIAMMADKLSELIKYKWIENYLMFNRELTEETVNATEKVNNNHTVPHSDLFK